VHPHEDVRNSVASRAEADVAPPRRSWPSAALLGGGTDGNEELTSRVGVVLIVLFAVLGVTILQIRQLIWLHLFLGLLLLGPVALKLASTGYRFVRYYARDTTYLRKGPPELALRAMGPILVASTMAVFTSGIVLLFEGPRNRALPLLIHKASFIVWLVFVGLHIVGHLPGFASALRASNVSQEGLGTATGAAGRWIVLVGAIVGGVVLALALIPHFGLWTAPGAFPHHHH